MSEIKRKKVRLRDISISYLLSDSDEAEATIIFIHGFPFNKNTWVPQLQDLPDQVRGIAYDVRGHGNSTTGHGYFNLDVFAKDLLAFIEWLDAGPVVVCGVSMGGYIALRAHEMDPEKFRGLILCDTHSFDDPNEGRIKRFATIESVLKNGKRTFAIGFAKNVLSEKTRTNKKEVVDLIKSSIRRNNERNICATLLALASRTDTTHTLSHIRVPVLLLRGEEDQIVSKEQMNKMEKMIPDVRYLEFPGCGHLPNLENDTRFNGEIRNFFISKIM
ncbi:alpha/beta fold hydrolase [Albibacterium indicum]|uniref:alpha/beta fold hydrolase n=1 Tax=Albibacterium indicum TaxID=2292082 RepID=UPI000E52B31D|nr:alpha/beta hydrolase [Pedobacter indicus]